MREAKLIIVTYGNGVPLSLEALHDNLEVGKDTLVVDCPYLSAVPAGLRAVLNLSGIADRGAILFADVCKEGIGAPLHSHACVLQTEGMLPHVWAMESAARAYNPLGSTVTFLSPGGIVSSARRLLRRLNSK